MSDRKMHPYNSSTRKVFLHQRSLVSKMLTEHAHVDGENETSPREKRINNEHEFSDFCVRDVSLASVGRREIEIAEQDMCGIMSLRRRASKDLPLKGANIACCVHITSQTAVVIETLKDMGASAFGSCKTGKKDEVAAALAARNIPIYSWKNETDEDYWWCLENVVNLKSNSKQADNVELEVRKPDWIPNMILDDGSDLTNFIQKHNPEVFKDMHGIVEESIAGVQRLYSMARKGQLTAPAINICDSVTKTWFDNVYLCREAVLDALKQTTDTMIGGRTVLVCGYGETGKTVCKSLRSMGCSVYVTEIDPICALQACMEGYKVIRLTDAFEMVDTYITSTGNKSVLDIESMRQMKNGSIVCSIGHSPSEIDATFFSDPSKYGITIERGRDCLDHIIFPDGKRISVINQGRNITDQLIVPPLVISITACNQVLALIELFSAANGRYKPDVYLLPRKMDEYVASLHLSFFDAHLTELSTDQCEYLGIKRAGPFKSISYRY